MRDADLAKFSLARLERARNDVTIIQIVGQVELEGEQIAPGFEPQLFYQTMKFGRMPSVPIIGDSVCPVTIRPDSP